MQTQRVLFVTFEAGKYRGRVGNRARILRNPSHFRRPYASDRLNRFPTQRSENNECEFIGRFILVTYLFKRQHPRTDENLSEAKCEIGHNVCQ